MTDPQTPPEARQCLNLNDANYGAVAVKSGVPGFAWGVFHPANGGHWEASDDAVETWKLMK